jgi:hypothetical protein
MTTKNMRREITHQQLLWVLLLLSDQWWWALESRWTYMITCILSVLTSLATGKMGFPAFYKVLFWFLRLFSMKPISAMVVHDDECCNIFDMW